uniref:Peptidase C39 family protein n=1 Tax=Candidatus Kentrum sp. TUN TaxID=2126343 RepID=A0A450ZHS0_9GAMM|nr:MAG: Peptidase C39 family protein [Candidatus Kentron sp. TUN]VFK53352.1 MAG: Peptidase C39 family protein [Candidatus Kentron sp. TUN]
MKVLAFLMTLVAALINAEAQGKERTWYDIRYNGVERQKYDFSCGIASLITIIKYGYHQSYDEKEVLVTFLGSLEDSEEKATMKEGLSLFHLSQIAKSLGFNSYMRALKPEHLALLDRPIIVFLETPKFKHFAVFTGTRSNWVRLADPSRGVVIQHKDDFVGEWKGGLSLVLDLPTVSVPKLILPPVW